MSFDYDDREVFQHMHLVAEDVTSEGQIPRWGFICDSCGRDSRIRYSGKQAVLSFNLDTICQGWYQHLISSHKLSFPKPSCPVQVYVGKVKLYCQAGEVNHEGKHKFEL